MYALVPRSLLVEFGGSLMYSVISSANRDSLASSFPVYVSLKQQATLAQNNHSHFKTES